MQTPIKKICVHDETKQWRNKMFATVTLYLTFTLILDLGIYLFFSKQLLVKTSFGCLALMALIIFLPIPKVSFPYLVGLLLMLLFYSTTKKLFISCLISNLFFAITGLSFFLVFDLLNYLGRVHLGTASFLALLVAFIFYLLVKSIDKRTKFLNLLFTYPTEHYFGCMCILLSWGVIFLVLGSVHFRSSDYLLLSLLSIVISFFSLLFSIMLISFQVKERQHQESLQLYQINEEYYHHLEEFKHDYKSLLFSLKSTIQENKKETLKFLEILENYSAAILEEPQKQQLTKILSPVVRGVFLEFLEKAESEKIPIQVVIPVEVKTIPIDLVVFIRCLSIFISNAFDHRVADQSPITINLLEEKEGLRFSIANKANPTNLTLAEMVQRGKTSKKTGGLGLYSAKKMLDAYENAELKIDFSKQNHCFFVEMYLAARHSESVC
ncbi:TPA: GHKL domain-containing protein [Enterococcus faecium]|uniref:GHKL domain-containing protein n=1 Tax=Enterococcus faecium TaxID=1352 RepID=UPI0009B53CFD|nr:GHKL domain-containing protein [Enterococcus faecium]EGP4936473.1 GHKL domain-containing protein [Enterococcus faecium]EGP5213893.1 GHKL domain-containing protein [Enterococcus faecium]EGP5527102.1 GHKL domain-containing protein [Enterococcus faecium]EME7107726.1 GHKL domain-containing protein [Enterococcus faecium]EME7217155.1 GHKL domain-containing protein [Enterococcus faecium]